MTIEPLPYGFVICQVPDFSDVCLEDRFCFVGRTDRERSVVCLEERIPRNAAAVSPGWRAFRIQGTMDFSLVGVLSGIAGLLAAESISIFAISTFDTDYLLTRTGDFTRALEVLERAGYTILR